MNWKPGWEVEDKIQNLLITTSKNLRHRTVHNACFFDDCCILRFTDGYFAVIVAESDYEPIATPHLEEFYELKRRIPTLLPDLVKAEVITNLERDVYEAALTRQEDAQGVYRLRKEREDEFAERKELARLKTKYEKPPETKTER